MFFKLLWKTEFFQRFYRENIWYGFWFYWCSRPWAFSYGKICPYSDVFYWFSEIFQIIVFQSTLWAAASGFHFRKRNIRHNMKLPIHDLTINFSNVCWIEKVITTWFAHLKIFIANQILLQYKEFSNWLMFQKLYISRTIFS